MLMQAFWKMMRKLRKTKKGQSVLEIGICAPVVLVFTLGLVDIMKFNIIYMDVSYFTKKAVTNFASDPSGSYSKYVIIMKDDLKNKGIFKYNFKGKIKATDSTNTQGEVWIMQPEDTREVAVKKGQKAGAGAQVCFSFDYAYNPIYNLAGKKLMYGNVTECAIMEYSGYYPDW